MRNRKIIFLLGLLLFIVLGLIGTSCNKEEVNPKFAILGKWEIIENDYGPISYPGSYQVYRPDSILFNFNSNADTSYSKYWFSDSLLFVDNQPYKFKFLSYNKLRLDFQQPAIVTTFIFQRIK